VKRFGRLSNKDLTMIINQNQILGDWRLDPPTEAKSIPACKVDIEDLSQETIEELLERFYLDKIDEGVDWDQFVIAATNMMKASRWFFELILEYAGSNCPHCNGTGYVNDINECPVCGGC